MNEEADSRKKYRKERKKRRKKTDDALSKKHLVARQSQSATLARQRWPGEWIKANGGIQMLCPDIIIVFHLIHRMHERRLILMIIGVRTTY